MEQYSYEEFLKDLNMGREIHFIYKDEEYFISQFKFWRFHDPASVETAENVDDLLTKVKLDEKTIRKVWDLIKLDSIF